jgi:uncharacterized protein (TIGR02646 family)
VRKIEKGSEPQSLTRFKRSNPNDRYDDLTERERRDVRSACTQEQYFLCAYCCQTITGSHSDTVNEHVEAQRLAPDRTLDFGNIVASCKTPRQCDAAHGSQLLALTPLMHECQTELRFRLSGRVEGMTPRAVETIRVLNLGDTEANNKALIEKRRQLIGALIWDKYGKGAEDLAVEDDPETLELLLTVVEDVDNGRLAAFAPVLSNFLRERLARS